MTIRVAFLGDSHTACVALAARSMDLGPFHPTFFAHVLRQLDGLRVDQGQLHAGNEDLSRVLMGTSGGFDAIDPKQFDLFVLMGLDFEFPFDCMQQQFYSKAVTEQTVRDQLPRSLAFSTLVKLRRVTNRPVWLLHAPLMAATQFTRRPEVLTYARFLNLAAEVFRPLGASVLPQPEKTRVDDHFSPLEFSRSPVRLKHSDGSPLLVEQYDCHKNEDFGREVVSDLVARLESFRPNETSDFSDPVPSDSVSVDLDFVGSGSDTWRPRRLGTIHERNGDQMLIRLAEGAGVQLNPTAALIWEHCDGSRTESEILAELCELFGASAEILRHDLRQALDQLIDVGALARQSSQELIEDGGLQTDAKPDIGQLSGMNQPLRLRLGLVSETTKAFLNQAKLCLFSLRKNGGALSAVPVTLITNSEPLNDRERKFFVEHFSPIEFRTSPRLGAIPHTSKLNVFYSIDPSTYDVLLFMDCDTVVRQRLDHIADRIVQGVAQFVCRRGGETDRNMFVDFNALVNRFCGQGSKDRILYEGQEEWPMFNSGVFLASSKAVREVRRCSVEFTYRLFNEWQRANALERLPKEIRNTVNPQQIVRQSWTIEQGALALACINAGVKVQYLDGTYNSWGGEADFHVLHCFKSLYQFDRGSMFSADAEQWIEEYLASDIPGKVFLASMVREYKQAFHADNAP